MQHLWSPWRMTYITNYKRDSACAFCAELAKSDGPENLIVARWPLVFLILNRYPYNSGHLMVCPYEHVATLDDLEEAARIELMEMSTRAAQTLTQVYHPQGFNLGINLGAAGGAGIEEHIHMHILPRWGGDTNFISTLGTTRVLPESLEETYRRIKQAWEASPNPPPGKPTG